jgi:signal transduction histidine kinase
VVGQLTGVAVHDFRNILAIFQNAAGILTRRADADTRELGADLLQSARSGQAIMAGLLSLARMEEPQRPIIDVARAVEELRPLATRLLGPRCRLSLVAEGPALAAADPGQIEQVVLNLAANARDAMADGGLVSIRVRSLARASAEGLGSTIEASGQVLVEVADQGVGVPAEIRERLFEPFVTTKPRGQGTGLGLASVRSIATGSSGCVVVESAPGQGATFRVFLPEAEPPEQARVG